ncbi:MAG: response regulator [Nannocystaceae bacterium]|nr:response regulator [Myxococcales bacterium]
MGFARHVVVADPEPQSRRRLARVVRALELPDVEIHEAATGTEALLLIDRHRPQLVLTEIILADLNGLALIRRVREIARENEMLPPTFIAVTSMVRETDRYWALRNGVHTYVTKPYDDEVLQARIRDVLRHGTGATPERIVPEL